MATNTNTNADAPPSASPSTAAYFVEELETASTENSGTPWRTLPFAVRLPSHVLSSAAAGGLGGTLWTDWDADGQPPAKATTEAAVPSAVLPGTVEDGVVGTMTFFHKSVYIWLGWGKVQATVGSAEKVVTPIPSIQCRMGPLMIAMPARGYQSTFGGGGNSSAVPPPSSKLIGSDSVEDEELAQAMAVRLQQKLQQTSGVHTDNNNKPETRPAATALLVSCQLHEGLSGALSSSSSAAAASDDGLGGMSAPTGMTLAHQAAAYAEREVLQILRRELTSCA